MRFEVFWAAKISKLWHIPSFDYIFGLQAFNISLKTRDENYVVWNICELYGYLQVLSRTFSEMNIYKGKLKN